MGIFREKMVEKNLTLRELSKKTGIGVVSLSEIERDCKADASAGEVEKLFEVLGISLNYLLDPDYRTRAWQKLAEEDARFGQTMEARRRIVEHFDKVMAATKRIVECPRCKEKLFYSIHSDGHIWAQCETKDCLYLME